MHTAAMASTHPGSGSSLASRTPSADAMSTHTVSFFGDSSATASATSAEAGPPAQPRLAHATSTTGSTGVRTALPPLGDQTHVR